MKIKEYLTEGKYKVIRGKFISFPDGSGSTMPEYGTDTFIVFDNGKETVYAQQKSDGSIYCDIDNKYSKEYGTLKDFVYYLNKYKMDYQGFDDI